MWLFAAAFLSGMSAAPLDMPRATAFLAQRGPELRLVDKYSAADLWTARTVLGRWYDDNGRVFVWSRLAFELPPVNGDIQTREEYEASLAALAVKDFPHLENAIAALSPVEIQSDYARPHQKPRGFKDVRYFEGTNGTAIVCAFLPEKSTAWQLAVWELAEGDDIVQMRKRLEDGILKELVQTLCEADGSAAGKDKPVGERELLKRDAEKSVAMYREWHASASDDFIVLDAMSVSREVVGRLTNDLAQARRRFQACIPGPLDGTNTLCVARIFANRDDYLDVAGEDKAWTAAFWSQERRELVAYLPADGEAQLRKTMRHESFHQYLAYAGAMVMASPWFNEGYAEYFEDENDVSFFAGETPEELEAYAARLPELLAMDYGNFYGEDAALNYRLAHSIAYFIEHGAGEVRFRPFADLKRDYLLALVETQDMRLATVAAFRNNAKLVELFVTEWLKFYKNM